MSIDGELRQELTSLKWDAEGLADQADHILREQAPIPRAERTLTDDLEGDIHDLSIVCSELASKLGRYLQGTERKDID